MEKVWVEIFHTDIWKIGSEREREEKKKKKKEKEEEETEKGRGNFIKGGKNRDIGAKKEGRE
jgi:hypothetical protein